MKCDICNKRESTIHIKEIVNGEKKNSLNICLKCAAKRGFNLLDNNIDILIEDIIPELAFDEKLPSNTKFKIEYNCSYCGNDFADFIESFDTKCEKCYEVFDDIIENILLEKNGSLEYRGKIPNGLSDLQKNSQELKELRKKLKEYINNEDFTNAAVLRDRINSLKASKRNELFNDKNRE